MKVKLLQFYTLKKQKLEKKYWFSDDLLRLKHYVENGDNDEKRVGVLYRVETEEDLLDFPFYIKGDGDWRCLYPYEEPPKKRMTNRQLAEWLARGNGQYTLGRDDPKTHFEYDIELDDKEVDEGYIVAIRSWDSDEWVEPTYEIYLRDCKV